MVNHIVFEFSIAVVTNEVIKNTIRLTMVLIESNAIKAHTL